MACDWSRIPIEVLGSGMANLTETMVKTVAIRCLVNEVRCSTNVGHCQTINSRPNIVVISSSMGVVATGAGIGTNRSNVCQI